MAENRKGSHTVYNIQYHLVWVTKYRYKVLRGEVAERTRELIRQSCMSREISSTTGEITTTQIEEYIAGHNEEDPGEQFTVDAE